MKKLILIFVLLLNIACIAQEDKTITLTVSGTGKTLEEAKNNALRSAIEQAFGAFISSKTEMLNDEIVKDEIVSVTNGNIQKYDVVSQVEIPNVGYSIIINTIVSISKLTSFAQSKGVSVEIKGGIYALNIKQQLLNEEGEINSISQIFGQIHELLQNSFDYKLIVKEPLSINSNSQNWKIPITVEAYSNKNAEIAAELLINSLSSLSLTKPEVENYKNLGKKLYLIKLKYKNELKEFYLRRPESQNILENIKSNWFFYVTNFSVNNNSENIYLSNRVQYYIKKKYPEYFYKISSKSVQKNDSLNELIPYYKEFYPLLKLHPISFIERTPVERGDYINLNSLNLDLLSTETKSISLDFEDIKTLQELETLDVYKINCRGIISPYKYGGYLLNETPEKISIVAPFNIINDNSSVNNGMGTTTDDDLSDWITGQKLCSDFKLNNYKDWKMPNRNDLLLIKQNLVQQGISSFIDDNYWSNEEDAKNTSDAYYQTFPHETILEEQTTVTEDSQQKWQYLKIRPIRFINK